MARTRKEAGGGYPESDTQEVHQKRKRRRNAGHTPEHVTEALSGNALEVSNEIIVAAERTVESEEGRILADLRQIHEGGTPEEIKEAEEAGKTFEQYMIEALEELRAETGTEEAPSDQRRSWQQEHIANIERQLLGNVAPEEKEKTREDVARRLGIDTDKKDWELAWRDLVAQIAAKGAEGVRVPEANSKEKRETPDYINENADLLKVDRSKPEWEQEYFKKIEQKLIEQALWEEGKSEKQNKAAIARENRGVAIKKAAQVHGIDTSRTDWKSAWEDLVINTGSTQGKGVVRRPISSHQIQTEKPLPSRASETAAVTREIDDTLDLDGEEYDPDKVVQDPSGGVGVNPPKEDKGPAPARPSPKAKPPKPVKSGAKGKQSGSYRPGEVDEDFEMIARAKAQRPEILKREAVAELPAEEGITGGESPEDARKRERVEFITKRLEERGWTGKEEKDSRAEGSDSAPEARESERELPPKRPGFWEAHQAKKGGEASPPEDLPLQPNESAPEEPIEEYSSSKRSWIPEKIRNWARGKIENNLATRTLDSWKVSFRGRSLKNAQNKADQLHAELRTADRELKSLDDRLRRLEGQSGFFLERRRRKIEREIAAIEIDREELRGELEGAVHDREIKEARLSEKAKEALEKIDAVLTPYLEAQNELAEQAKNLGETIQGQIKYLSKKRSQAAELSHLARQSKDRFEKEEAKALLKELQKEIDEGDAVVKKFDKERAKVFEKLRESRESSARWKEKKAFLEGKTKEKSRPIQIPGSRDLRGKERERANEQKVDPSILNYQELYERTREREVTIGSLLDAWNTLNPIFKVRLEDILVPGGQTPNESLDAKVKVQRFEDAVWSHWRNAQREKKKGLPSEAQLKHLISAFIEKVEEEESKQKDA